jgi:hypothetical protein
MRVREPAGLFRIIRRALPVVVMLTLAGCDQLRSDPSSTDREAFIATVVELRRALKTARTQSAYEKEKAQVLTRRGTSAAALEEFVRVHGANPSYMSAVWDSIANRLERPVGDSVSRRVPLPDSTRASGALRDSMRRLASPRVSADTGVIPRH